MTAMNYTLYTPVKWRILTLAASSAGKPQMLFAKALGKKSYDKMSSENAVDDDGAWDGRTSLTSMTRAHFLFPFF